MIKFKMAELRPLSIVKFSLYRDSLKKLLCFASKFMPYIHFTKSSDEFKIGQDLGRN